MIYLCQNLLFNKKFTSINKNNELTPTHLKYRYTVFGKIKNHLDLNYR